MGDTIAQPAVGTAETAALILVPQRHRRRRFSTNVDSMITIAATLMRAERLITVSLEMDDAIAETPTHLHVAGTEVTVAQLLVRTNHPTPIYVGTVPATPVLTLCWPQQLKLQPR